MVADGGHMLKLKRAYVMKRCWHWMRSRQFRTGAKMRYRPLNTDCSIAAPSRTRAKLFLNWFDRLAISYANRNTDFANRFSNGP
jgi:hypothetical protein